MKFLSIQTKIICWTIFFIIITIGFLLVFTLISDGKNRSFIREKVSGIVNDATKNRLTSEAQAAASGIQRKMAPAIYTAHSLSQTFKGIKIENEAGDALLEIGRTELKGILKSVLEQQKDFLGIYTCWEPYGLDALDDSFKNDTLNGYDQTGRFIPYFYWNTQKDQIRLTAVKDYESSYEYAKGVRKGEFYLRPREQRQLSLIDPFPYEKGSRQGWRISITSPITHKDNFYGIVGVDLDLAFLQKAAEDINANLYKGQGQVAIVSRNGIISADSNKPERIGTHISEVFPDDWQTTLATTIEKGAFRYLDDTGYIKVNMPIRFAHTYTNWAVIFIIPKTIVMKETIELNRTLIANGTKSLIWQIVVSSAGVIVLCIALFSLLSVIVIKPLSKTVSTIQEIAKGDLSLRTHLKGSDEIKLLADAVDNMADSLENRARVANAIARGDLSQKITLLSGKDQLGKAYQLMIDSLLNKAKAAENIAEGYLAQEIEIASENDTLGKSFQVMIKSIREIVQQANVIALGDYSSEIHPRSAKDELGNAFNKMTISLREMSEANLKQDWIKTGQANLSQIMSGDKNIVELCRHAITYIAKYINAKIGTIYIRDIEKEDYKLIASYAFKERKGLANSFRPGEGLVGQAALEKEQILFTEVPEDYIKIESSLGHATPNHLLVQPLIYEDEVKGVIELGATFQYTDQQLEFIGLASHIAAVAINAALANEQLNTLFHQTKEQAEALQTQQEELKTTNEELEEQTKILKDSESRLQEQQEELQASNEELEEKTELLETQKEEIENKNRTLIEKQKEVEEKANQLELATKYKSEFLSNMSHELRTPLNSMLLLAKILADNDENNLSADQVESAHSIHRSGQNLLRLINDILDLSKIEARKIELHISRVKPQSIVSNFKAEFTHLAKEKGIEFHTEIEEGLPESIETDEQKLEQILRNLLGNAFKFTDQGSVSLSISRAADDIILHKKDLPVDQLIAFSVSDTGCGIADDKRQVIFDAFKQVDGSISRRHGGTGLGLSISKELTLVLGGELTVFSSPEGSRFTLYLAERFNAAVSPTEDTGQSTRIQADPLPKKEEAGIQENRVSSETADIISHPETKTVLIIEDDPEFAEILSGFFRQHGYEPEIASNGEKGVKSAIGKPPTAIVLDIGLPGIDGWTVLNELKNTAATRHIPVHIMSAYDDIRNGLQKGAVGYLTKPVSKTDLEFALSRIEDVINSEVKELLIVEDDRELRSTILNLMGAHDIHATATGTGKETLELLKTRHFDCMILDLGLPDIPGFDLLEKMAEDPEIEKTPVIIYTGRDLTQEETEMLERYSASIVLKNAVSLDRLLDETTLFMHRVESEMPEDHQKMLQQIRDRESVLTGKKVLIVDDDMRNAFALNRFLKNRGMEASIAKNGQVALEKLSDGEIPDIILMDIMMPVMDGYETIRQIRKEPRYRELPILALTAKAMESDREECIKAGANDYLSKPVDTTKLISMLRIWLY